MAKKTLLEKRICKECGEEFMQNRSWQEFCSSRCRHIHWTKDQKRDAPTLKNLEKRVSEIEKSIKIFMEGR